MNLDRQRIEAVRSLQAQGYAWDGTMWTPPAGSARQPLSETDFELLCTTVRRHFGVALGEFSAMPLWSEIKSWGWFR